VTGGLIFLGVLASFFGLYGGAGHLYQRSGGNVDRGTIYQIAWPVFMRLTRFFVTLAAVSFVAAAIVTLAT
jgi:hypothetical protein